MRRTVLARRESPQGDGSYRKALAGARNFMIVTW